MGSQGRHIFREASRDILADSARRSDSPVRESENHAMSWAGTCVNDACSLA